MLGRKITVEGYEFGLDTGGVFSDPFREDTHAARLSFSVSELQQIPPETLLKIATWFVANGKEACWLMTAVHWLDADCGGLSPADALRVMECPFATENDREIARSWLLSRDGPPRANREKVRPIKKAGTVYLLAADDGSGRYKIGRTTQIGARTRHFETKLPFEVSLRYSFECEDAPSMERILHERFGEQRINGEWFYLSDEDVRGIEAEFRTEVG